MLRFKYNTSPRNSRAGIKHICCPILKLFPFYSYAETKLLPEDAKKEYVDCLAFKITTEYPNGISGVQKDSLKKTITKSRESCLKLVVNKYQKLKHKNLKPEVESR